MGETERCWGIRELRRRERGAEWRPCSGDVTSVVGRRDGKNKPACSARADEERRMHLKKKGFAIKNTPVFERDHKRHRGFKAQGLKLDSSVMMMLTNSKVSVQNPVFEMCKSVCSTLQNSVFPCSTQTIDVKDKLQVRVLLLLLSIIFNNYLVPDYLKHQLFGFLL